MDVQNNADETLNASQRRAIYYQQHRDKIRDAQKSYYQRNRERILEKQKREREQMKAIRDQYLAQQATAALWALYYFLLFPIVGLFLTVSHS